MATTALTSGTQVASDSVDGSTVGKDTIVADEGEDDDVEEDASVASSGDMTDAAAAAAAADDDDETAPATAAVGAATTEIDERRAGRSREGTSTEVGMVRYSLNCDVKSAS
jgi:hypothetical protein